MPRPGLATRRAGPGRRRLPRRASSSARVTATVVRPGAPVGPHTATTDPRRCAVGAADAVPVGGMTIDVAAAGSPNVRIGRVLLPSPKATASAITDATTRGSSSSGTRWCTPIACSRSSAAESPRRTTPTGATPDATSRSTASASNRRNPAATSAARACPVAATASKSTTSTQRRTTATPWSPRSSATTSPASQAAPSAALSTGSFTSSRRSAPGPATRCRRPGPACR